MNFDTFDTHQLLLLRPLIILLMVAGVLLVAAIVGSYRRLRNKRITDAGAQADFAAAAPGHARGVVRLEKSVAPRDESTPRLWARGGHPSGRHAA